MIDDSPVFLELMREILENEGGYEVTTLDGSEGTVAYADAVPAELIVLDVAFRNGPTGVELAEQLAATDTTAGIPILFCTALRERELNRIASSLMRTHTHRILFKPFDIEAVLLCVAELLLPQPSERQGYLCCGRGPRGEGRVTRP